MTDLSALKLAKEVFMQLPASTIAEFKEGVNSLELSERYNEIIHIYEQGFIDAIKIIRENDLCQKNLQKTKKQLQENS